MHYPRLIYFFSSLFIFLFGSFCSGEEAPLVLVSVAPYKSIVEEIAGDSVTVQLMVPAAANAHAYEPTPKQMVQASRAAVWFTLGESFEKRVIPVLRGNNPNLRLIDLKEGIKLISSSCCHANHLHPDALDLHIWLSPRLMKKQAETICAGLKSIFPEKTALFQAKIEKLLQNLDQLDQKIAAKIKKGAQTHLLVSHPSFAYFCKEYGLDQFSIECEGKDPTPKQLTEVINKARQYQIKTIFTQKQFSNKGAKIIAAQIGAKLVEVDPYAENYFPMMLALAQAFSEN